MKFERHLPKECRKKNKAKKKGNHTGNVGVADMNATFFMVHTNTIPVYTPFLENHGVNTHYPEFNKSNISSEVNKYMYLI